MNNCATCATCAFWEEWHPKADRGECRRYALRSGDESSSWPETNDDDWCGEHEPRKDAP